VKTANRKMPSQDVVRVRRRPGRRRIGDWTERVPTKAHIPIEQRVTESIIATAELSEYPSTLGISNEETRRMLPRDVIPVLRQAEIDFMLVGAYGAATWLPEERSTQDVDFLIPIKDRKKATNAVLRKFPDLVLEKCPDVHRFLRNERFALDLMFTRAPLFKRVIKEFRTGTSGGLRVKVPKLEAALAMKFAAMTGHYRRLEKKHYDAGDFIAMVRQNAEIDMVLLREIGELVYSGGGAEIVKYVEDVRAGRKLEI